MLSLAKGKEDISATQKLYIESKYYSIQTHLIQQTNIKAQPKDARSTYTYVTYNFYFF